MERHLPIACGLDVHRDIIEACIVINNEYEKPEIVRKEFTTVRGDLFNLRDWLMLHNCKNVAMESTGVYWRPVYAILEEVEGINLCLVNAQHMKNLPGRKTDVKDAQWIAELFICGLLEYSFVPEKGIRQLRECTRYYRKLKQERNRILNRIDKLLQTHGFKLSSVLSSIDGVSARRILDKLCEYGEVTVTDIRAALARGVKKTAEEIAFAINGKLDRIASLVLKHMLDGLKTLDNQLVQLDEVMEEARADYKSEIRLLSTIPGVDELSATYIIAEIGVDMSPFAVNDDKKKPASRICSWAGLTPKNDTSAGKVKSRKIKKGNNYVKTILVQCAWAATKCRNKRLANWYWSHAGKLGQKTAIIAVARKLLVYMFHMITNGEVYNNDLDSEASERIKAKKLDSAKRLLEASQKSPPTERSKGPKSPISSPDPAPPGIPPPSIPPKKRGRPKKNPNAA